MKKRALITGINGFVGSYLAQHLREEGWEVFGLGIIPDDGVIPCDITDRAQVDRVLEDTAPVSHVFHLAAQTFVPAANEHPQDTMAINYGGTVNLLQSLASTSPETRFVYISSADAYGPPQYLPMDERHPLNPPNAYAISKAAADHYCAFFTKASDVPVIRMRPFNHSGPGQSDQFVLPSFARQIADIELGKQPPVIKVGNLDAARDFLHVHDVVRAYALAAQHAENGAVFNVCSGSPFRIQEALDALLAKAKVSITVEPDPARMRPTDVPEVRGDASTLHQATGWEAKYRFEDLLDDLLEYWRKQCDGGS